MLHRPLYRFLGSFLKKHDRRKIAAKILMAEEFEYAMRHAQIVNSRSILFACDIYPSKPQSSTQNIDYLTSIPNTLARNKQFIQAEMPAIYVPTDGLDYFHRQILSQIDRPFVLVSGDSDLSVNEKNLGLALSGLLSDWRVSTWYAQNRDCDHPKLRSIPIGINVHNLWFDPLQWGGGFLLPSLQELQIQTLAQNAQDFAKRRPTIFCNWHFSIDRADRKECYTQIDHALCEFQPKPLPMAKTWELQSNHQFVLSPAGAGLDCHRTWEALVLGCIPIIKTATINDLFTDLPVVVVHDWTQVNQTLLQKAVKEISQKKINLEKLSMQYWRDQIHQAKTGVR